MKNILAVVSLVLVAFSFQANAATYNLGVIEDSTGFLKTNVKKGAFTDIYNFFTNASGSFAGNASNSYVSVKTNITNFAADLDGHAFEDKSTNGQHYFTLSLSSLLAGAHKLTISGISGGGATYSGNIAVAQTPIPAAVWLFGSAFMGMFGLRRKKA